MKKKITTTFILASIFIGNTATAQEDNNVEYIEWAEDGNLDEVKNYLAKGADINYIDENGRGAGEYAIWNIDEDKGVMINYLLGNGLKVKYKNKDGENLLQIAAEYEGNVVFKKLIEKGITIDEVTEKGETAVFIAAENKDFEAVKLLVSLGSNIQIANNDGRSIVEFYDLESESNWNDLMSFNLSKAQLDVLLLKCAFHLESLEKVKLLVEKGADVNVKNENDIPLIELAEDFKTTEIYEYLKSKGAKL